MTDLAAIIRATRASATALATMAKHAREAANASHVMATTDHLVAMGRLTPGAAGISLRIAATRKAQAEAAHKRASAAYDRAQLVLARNPL